MTTFIASTRTLLFVSVLLGGCAHRAGPPVHVRAGAPIDLQGLDTRKNPLIIEFREGDTLPLGIAVEGDLVAAPADSRIPLTVKRRFFVRIEGSSIRTSLDGSFKDALRTRGSLGFGFGVNGAGSHAEVRLKPPMH